MGDFSCLHVTLALFTYITAFATSSVLVESRCCLRAGFALFRSRMDLVHSLSRLHLRVRFALLTFSVDYQSPCISSLALVDSFCSLRAAFARSVCMSTYIAITLLHYFSSSAFDDSRCCLRVAFALFMLRVDYNLPPVT